MVDMGTLADLLRGLAEGRNIDTTPFGTWGVRDMDPGRLGTMMDAAQEINQRRQQAQLAAQAQKYAADSHLAGIYDQGDVNVRGQDTQERIAAQNAIRAAAEANLKSGTRLEQERMRGVSAQKVAEIQANPKSMSKIPDMLASTLHQMNINPKTKPEDYEGMARTMEIMGRKEAAEALMRFAANLRSDQAKKQTETGPGAYANFVANLRKPMPIPDFTPGDQF
jgi:hypothetical protein